MPDPVPLSAFGLRNAMRDPRYWQSGHPERADYRAWVTDAWQQVHAAENRRNSDGLAWVNPYTRTRAGRTEEVSGHYRHSGGASGPDGSRDNGNGYTVVAEDRPSHDIERRYTARDASGALIGRCERLIDGSQFCTLAMPDGGVAVQQLQPGNGEFTPVAAPAFAAAVYGFPLFVGAATAFYNYLSGLQATPGSSAAPDTPFMLFYRGFEGTQPDVRVTVGSLARERVNEFCPKTAEFEASLTEIANATAREGLSPQQWGTAVHTAMRREIQQSYPLGSGGVRAEFSLVRGVDENYGAPGSTRLDIYHHVEGTSTICAYDIKTGQALLNAPQAERIYREAYNFAQRNGVADPRVLLIELRRTP